MHDNEIWNVFESVLMMILKNNGDALQFNALKPN
tara:strand:+ start:148 stop:249 length:102 start_codon:yes stop_codon:yes gene_type:complete